MRCCPFKAFTVAEDNAYLPDQYYLFPRFAVLKLKKDNSVWTQLDQHSKDHFQWCCPLDLREVRSFL